MAGTIRDCTSDVWKFCQNWTSRRILDSPYYVFVALCIVVIVVSLIKIAASNENIECFREYFAVGYRAPDPRFLYLRSRYYAIVRVSLWHQSATSLQIYDDVIVHQLATSLDIQCCTKIIQDGGRRN
jgi:hypothetical protein